MSFQDSDISWQVLRQIVQEWSGTSAELAEVKRLQGGVINTTLCLTLRDGASAVLKISPHRVNRDYDREVHQLELLRSLGLPVPQVYRLDIGSLDDPHSLILMQYIQGMNLVEARHRCSAEEYDELQCDLARVMLHMHSQTAAVYGRVTREDGISFEKWPDFFRHVYEPILKELEKGALLAPNVRKKIGKIHDKLDRLLAHGDVPRLVHWDCWATNLLAGPDEAGKWRIKAVLDPMCKYAHAEAELAYMDLFHTSNHSFIRAYQKQHRLDDGYHHVRKVIYQLYAMIDHVNLFGHDYVKPMLAALDKVQT